MSMYTQVFKPVHHIYSHHKRDRFYCFKSHIRGTIVHLVTWVSNAPKLRWTFEQIKPHICEFILSLTISQVANLLRLFKIPQVGFFIHFALLGIQKNLLNNLQILLLELDCSSVRNENYRIVFVTWMCVSVYRYCYTVCYDGTKDEIKQAWMKGPKPAQRDTN